MNPVLTQIIQNVLAKVHPENQMAYRKAVLAGKKILMDQEVHNQMTLQINPASRAPNIIASTIATGVTGLGWVLFKLAKGTMTIEVLGSACATLMCWVIDFAEKSYNVKFTNNMIDICTQDLAQNLLTKLGISQDQLNSQIKTGQLAIQRHLAGQPTPPPSGWASPQTKKAV